jgi:anti-sigma B factor antagonist
MEVRYQDSIDENWAHVSLHGECDMYSAPTFKASMLEKLRSGVKRILIDMSGILYLDSTGVGAIISILQAANRNGSEISFQGIEGHTRQLLERTRILPLMKEAALSPVVSISLGEG